MIRQYNFFSIDKVKTCLGAAFLLVLSSCVTTENIQPAGLAAIQNDSSDHSNPHSNVLPGDWVLMTVTSQAPDNDVIPPRTEPLINISRTKNTDTSTASQDYRLSGQFGCNRFVGTAQFFGTINGTVQVSQLALTRKACRPPLGVFEQHSIAILQSITNYTMTKDNSLQLTADNGEMLSLQKVTTKQLHIDSNLVDCMGMVMQKCMNVRSADGETLLLYQRIEGLKFEEGYEYNVLVDIIPIAHPPADGSSIRYVLRELLNMTRAGG